MRGGFRKCANVGCTEYNKRFGAKIVRQKKKKKKKSKSKRVRY